MAPHCTPLRKQTTSTRPGYRTHIPWDQTLLHHVVAFLDERSLTSPLGLLGWERERSPGGGPCPNGPLHEDSVGLELGVAAQRGHFLLQLLSGFTCSGCIFVFRARGGAVG